MHEIMFFIKIIFNTEKKYRQGCCYSAIGTSNLHIWLFCKKIHMKLSIPTLQHQIGCPSFTYLQGRQVFPAGHVDVSVIYCHSQSDRGVTVVYAFLLFIIYGLKVNCRLKVKCRNYVGLQQFTCTGTLDTFFRQIKSFLRF